MKKHIFSFMGIEITVELGSPKMIKQKTIAEKMGITHISEVRDLVHSMRMKGYGVLSDCRGMARTESRKLKDAQAEALLSRAKEIISASEGLMRKDKEPLTEDELILWNMLPEFEEDKEADKPWQTDFQPISREEVESYVRAKN